MAASLQPDAFFGNSPIQESQEYGLMIAQQPFNVDWPAKPYELYTVVLYDLSAPSPDNPYNSPFIHFLAINTPGKNIAKADILMNYIPPSPPIGTQSHLYVLDIYSQPNKITATITDRNRYDPVKLANQTGSVLEARLTFYVKSEELLPRKPKEAWLREGNPLPPQKQNFCRCVLDVAGKQPSQCNVEKAWRQQREGKTCYNPYAVCAKSVGTTSRQCGMWYEFEHIPDRELMGYASLNKIDIPSPYNRTQLLSNIYAWKGQK